MPVRDRTGREGRIGPLMTFVDHVRPDGAVARWGSRRHRKHLEGPAGGSTWWAPGARGWWIAVLFAVGSLVFALGAIPAYASATGARWDALTFFIGSICFLVASALAWFEVCHGWAAWRPRSWAWWITLANLIGSVAFGVSAVAGYINPATGQLHNAERSNLGTLIGALCFFAGALMLLPERTGESRME